MTHDARQHAPATGRNREPILNVLKAWLPQQGTVLEIAAGTGEHAIYFAEQFPELNWLPSDFDKERLKSIAAWTKDAALTNILSPVQIDVTWDKWPIENIGAKGQLDALFCANMIHIAPITALHGLVQGVPKYLKPDAPFILYGPFKTQYGHTAPSNAAFDESLKARDPEWGIRAFDNVVELALENGLIHQKTISMPANNFCMVFKNQS